MIEVCIFILGAAFSVILVPYAEDRRLRFLAKRRLELLFVELDDVRISLEQDARIYFQTLLNIRTLADLTAEGKVPIPVASAIDASLISRLYEESATLLTHEQRLLIKELPSTLQRIFTSASDCQESLVKDKKYCINSLKNVIRLSASEATNIKQLLSLKSDFSISKKKPNDFFEATDSTLFGLGFTEEQINLSRLRESTFHELDIDL